MNNRKRLQEGFSSKFEQDLIRHIADYCPYCMDVKSDKDDMIKEMEDFAKKAIESKSKQGKFVDAVKGIIDANDSWCFDDKEDVSAFVKALKGVVNVSEMNVSESSMKPVWVYSEDAENMATIFSVGITGSEDAEKISDAVSSAVDEDPGTFKVLKETTVDGMLVITTEHKKDKFKDVIILGGPLTFNPTKDKPLLIKALKKALGNDFDEAKFGVIGEAAEVPEGDKVYESFKNKIMEKITKINEAENEPTREEMTKSILSCGVSTEEELGKMDDKELDALYYDCLASVDEAIKPETLNKLRTKNAELKKDPAKVKELQTEYDELEQKTMDLDPETPEFETARRRALYIYRLLNLKDPEWLEEELAGAEELVKPAVTNEAKVDRSSVTFSGKPNVSSNLNAAAGQFQVWINGGNAFTIKSDPSLLKKLEFKGEAVENLQAKLMDIVVKALEDNFEDAVKEVI